jgi:hypothetical protein
MGKDAAVQQEQQEQQQRGGGLQHQEQQEQQHSLYQGAQRHGDPPPARHGMEILLFQDTGLPPQGKELLLRGTRFQGMELLLGMLPWGQASFHGARHASLGRHMLPYSWGEA